jgi:hypothetical protein
LANSWLNLPLNCRHFGYITKLTRKKTLGLLGPLFCECPPPLGFTPTRNFPRSDAARRVRSLNSSDCFFVFPLSVCPFPVALPCWPFPPFVVLLVCVFVHFHFTVFIFILPRFCIPGARLRQLVRCFSRAFTFVLSLRKKWNI